MQSKPRKACAEWTIPIQPEPTLQSTYNMIFYRRFAQLAPDDGFTFSQAGYCIYTVYIYVYMYICIYVCMHIYIYMFFCDIAGSMTQWRPCDPPEPPTLKDMKQLNVVPTRVTLGCMVEALASNDNPDGAYEVIQTALADPNTKGWWSGKKRMDKIEGTTSKDLRCRVDWWIGDKWAHENMDGFTWFRWWIDSKVVAAAVVVNAMCWWKVLIIMNRCTLAVYLSLHLLVFWPGC